MASPRESCYNNNRWKLAGDLSLILGALLNSPQAITKVLLPSKRANLLHRPRLVNFLHEHIDRKLLLISASAGYGKTSLLVDFAHDTTLPVCWYSLDASDSDPKVFFEYLLASLRRQFPEFGTRTLSLLSDPAMLRDVDVVVGTLVTEIHDSIPAYFVMILDDYHMVDESDAINQIVDTLLRLLPENAHLVLSSRTLPSKLTLTRLTARQEIAGLSMNDLRFTPEEISALMRHNDRPAPSDEEIVQLADHSEGWITGILLTTQSMWQGLMQDLVRIHGARSYVFNYLADEVLAHQPPELRRFLLDSSILDQLDPETCNQLLGIEDAEAVLREIERRNLFIVRLEGTGTWYRYHHLFQEFLQSRLVESGTTSWPELNRRAATLFEERAAWHQAIGHYLKAQAFEETARVVEGIAKETFEAGHWTTLAKWIDALPTGLLNLHPDLLVYRAMALDETGDRARAVETYLLALEIYEQQGNTTGMANALIKQASCWRTQGRFQEAIQNCRRALKLLGQDETREAAEARRVIGISYGMLGNWEQCIAELKSALRIHETLNDPMRVAWLHHDLGVAMRTAGQAESQEHFQHALDFWRRAKNTPGLANTLNSIGVGYHRQGDYTQAIETLEQALIEARHCGQLRIEAFALASLADVHRDTGEYARAQQLYQTAYDISRQINEGFLITYGLGALSETYRLMGDLETAQQLIHQAIAQAERHRSNYELGLTKISLGILNCAQGNTDSAIECFDCAIELLERGGAKREAARAHLHSAQVNYLQREYVQAGDHLKLASELGTQVGEDQFAIADRNSLLPLVRYAVSKEIGNGYFARLLQKMESLPSPPRIMQPAGAPVAQEWRAEARAFGKAAVIIDGRLISRTDWDSAAAKELFFFLLANPQGLPKEEILNTLWGDVPPAKANGIFHTTAYRMRRAVSRDCLLYGDGLYRINPGMNLWHDVNAFNWLTTEAERSHSIEDRVQYWREAIALYQGDYFEDSYSDWSIPIRTNLLDKFLRALTSLADHYGQDGRLVDAIELYQRILAKDNFREDIYRSLILLQLKSGDRSSALKTFQRCVQVLKDEVGVEPSPETQELYNRIVMGSTRKGE